MDRSRCALSSTPPAFARVGAPANRDRYCAMRSPRDTLEAELLEPADLAAAQRQWAVRVKGNGPLESFAGRLRPWVAGVPRRADGRLVARRRAARGAGASNVTLSQFNATELRTRLGGVDLYEPQVEAHGDFRLDAASSIVESQDLTFASSTIAGCARGVSIRLADVGPPTVRGDVALRGDLEKINAWLGRGVRPGAVVPRGQAVGRSSCRPTHRASPPISRSPPNRSRSSVDRPGPRHRVDRASPRIQGPAVVHQQPTTSLDLPVSASPAKPCN